MYLKLHKLQGMIPVNDIPVCYLLFSLFLVFGLSSPWYNDIVKAMSAISWCDSLFWLHGSILKKHLRNVSLSNYV